MKKKKATKKIIHRSKSTSKQRTNYRKGALGAGTAYGLLALLVLMSAGALMVGNIFPKSRSPQEGQVVIIATNTPAPKKDNLQLYTFPGATLTPTPTATPVPQPQQSSGGGNSGGGGGGNNSGGGSGGGGGSTCLVAGTKILLTDKSVKNIEDIKPGDAVMGYDTVNKKLMPETVLATDAPIRDHHYDITLADGTVIGITREHPLYSTKGWVAIDPASTLAENANLHVGTLKVGDKLLEASGHYVTVALMKFIKGNVQTYNLKNVTGYNDFVANGIITHNKGGSGGGSGGGGGGSSAM